jgi:hypothetical protein
MVKFSIKTPLQIIFIVVLVFLLIKYFFYRESYQSRRDSLLVELSSKSMVYKIKTIVNGQEVKQFKNMSDELITLLEDDVAYIPYVLFLMKLYDYRNENFRRSRTPCHKKFDEFFHELCMLLQESLDQKEMYFSLNDNDNYEGIRTRYFRNKSKASMTKLDYKVLEVFDNNQEEFTDACENHKNYEANSFETMFKIVF